MKLLIITQKVDKNDPILGFFCQWIVEFAKRCEQVTVICLYKGEYDLPENVKVLSLGKEERQSRLQYLIHFYWYISYEKKNYDTVFVHMNQIYVGLGGLLWRLWNKKIILWYTHRAVSMSLRIAALFAHDIFTASKEGFRIPTKKLHIVGHGIAVEQFAKKEMYPHEKLILLSVGRVTRIKNLETLVEACALLRDAEVDFSCDIVGPKVTPDDHIYLAELKKMIEDKNLENKIVFIDGVTNEKVKKYYHQSDININLTPTGGIDKVVLEGIAAEIIPLVSNRAFEPLFGKYADDLIFNHKDAASLAQKIMNLKELDLESVRRMLRQKVEENYGVEGLVEKIIEAGKNKSNEK